MASDILSALDLDKESLNGKFITIKEFPGSDANFLINCLISKQIKRNHGVVLVALNNPLKHYQETGLSLGYNLKNTKDNFGCIDCLKLHKEQSTDPFSDKTSLNNLSDLVRKELDVVLAKCESVCLIVDGLLLLNDMQFSIQEINLFIQSFRSLMMKHDCLSIVVGTHVIPEDEESCVLAGLMSHMSDIVCEVSTLKTGRSFDITGSLTINRPFKSISNSLVKLNKYHYKIFERGVKVFAPGSR